jgi:hypothetical protein
MSDIIKMARPFLCVTDGAGYRLLMRLLNTDVRGSCNDYYVTRCDSVVSLPDKFYFAPRRVRYSFIRSVFKLTVVYAIVVHKSQKSLKGGTAFYRILSSPLSYTNSPSKWK